MTLKSWSFVGTVILGGLAIIYYSIFNALNSPNPAYTPHAWLAFIVLISLSTFSQVYEIEGTFRNTYYVHSVFFFAGTILLDPLLFSTLVTFPHLVEWIVKRLKNHETLRAWYIQPFNIATHLMAGFVTYSYYNWVIDNTDWMTTFIGIFVVTILAFLYTLINHILIGLALFFARGLSLQQSEVLKVQALLPEMVLGYLGYILALLWGIQPAFGLLALSPLVLMYEALRVPQLTQDAQTDVKTGLLNARYFNKLYEETLKRTADSGRPFSFLMADLDYMRWINNNYGHLAGDAVLAGIGRVIKQTIHDQHTCGRFGGEEFAIMLAGVTQSEAINIAESLRKAIEEANFEVPTSQTPIKVTVSIGVATFPYDGKDTTTITHAADLAMYHAKHCGRNQIAVYSNLPTNIIEGQNSSSASDNSNSSSALSPAMLSAITNETTTVDGNHNNSPVTNSSMHSELATKKEIYGSGQQKPIVQNGIPSLPEKNAWIDSLSKIIERRNNSKKAISSDIFSGDVAALLLDLDHFSINSHNLGYVSSDDLLIAVTNRIKSCIRSDDLLANFGENEFALLLGSPLNKVEVRRTCERVLAVLQTPFLIASHEINVDAYIGVILFSSDISYYRTTDEVIRDLHIALEKSKEEGSAKFVLYEPGMKAQTRENFDWEREIKKALDKDEFEVYYQPKVRLDTGQIVGVEALLRWHHPLQGTISPGEFIPIAERNGLICALGEWVLEKACIQLQKWNNPANGTNKALEMSVNLSPKQLEQSDIVSTVERILISTGVNPFWVQLEVTEGILIDFMDSVTTKLHQLKNLGIKLALDDFGKGYSSLNYVKQMPLDSLKIDKSFVIGMSKDEVNKAIVQAILNLGAALGMSVVAEGVETSEELAALNWLGCNYGQGYYFARPVSREKIEEMLVANLQQLKSEKHFKIVK